MNDHKKLKTTIYLPSTTLKKIDALKVMDDTVSSRSDIIDKAVDFYKSHVDLSQDIDYVAPIIKSVIEGSIDVHFKNVNRNLFKQAVETGVLTLCISKVFDIDDEMYDKARKKAFEETKRINGTISLLDAQK